MLKTRPEPKTNKNLLAVVVTPNLRRRIMRMACDAGHNTVAGYLREVLTLLAKGELVHQPKEEQ